MHGKISWALVAGILFLGLFSACSGPVVKMTEWRDDSFTTCCLKDKCDEKDWMESSKQYCTGNVSMVGGKYVNAVNGYQATHSGDKIEMNPVMGEQSCRIFKCTGSVVPSH